MGYPPPPQNPYGPQHPQPPYGPGGYPPHPSGHGPGPQPSKSSRDALVVLLAIGVPLLLLGGAAAVVMVLTDTGRNTVITETDGATMVMPSRDQSSDPPAAGDMAIQPPTAEAAGQGTTTDLAVQPPPAGGASQPAPVGGVSQPPQGQSGSTATVGGSITLQGTDPGLKMTVTVNRLVNPATPANQFSKPTTGNKFVAVEITLTNAGQAVYSGSPSSGAWLIDGEQQQHRSSFHDVSEGQGFGGSATINVGDSRKGVIVFEVPESARLTKFQYGLNSGFADQKGEWTLS